MDKIRNLRYVELGKGQCFVVGWYDDGIYERDVYDYEDAIDLITELELDRHIDSKSITVSIYEELFWESV